MQQRKFIDHGDRIALDRVFPIVDMPSALLMKFKARCVFDAGAITAAELAEIDRRANAAISRATAAAPADSRLEPDHRQRLIA
jgi:hypothetical protein